MASAFKITSSILPKRDFFEVQANRDTATCLSEPTLFLDVEATNIEGLVRFLTSNLARDEQDQILKSAFVDKQKNVFKDYFQGFIDGQKTQSWLIVTSNYEFLDQRQVYIAILKNPLDFGLEANRVKIFSLVLCPIIARETKSGFETGYTLATILSCPTFRQNLLKLSDKSRYKSILAEKVEEIKNEKQERIEKREPEEKIKVMNIIVGVVENFTRRARYYVSDFSDGVDSIRSINKVIATTVFLYFLCLLPCIAFGVLNYNNTGHLIGVDRALVGQALGGLVFAFIAGQPFVIIATTAPIALCNKLVMDFSQSLEVDFFDLYACVGLWNCFFLLVYGFLGLSSLIKFSTRSVEEIFSMFIVVCFSVDALKDLFENFSIVYMDPLGNREESLLFLFLFVGTILVAVLIYNMKFSVFLPGGVRDIVSDYALPISVILFTFISAFAFKDVSAGPIEVTGFTNIEWKIAKFKTITGPAVGVGLGLGFAMSLLFFMDQGVSAQLVDDPRNHLKKGNANDLDFINVALVNLLLSLFGFPWMHGLLPHSPLHVKSLADYEEKIVGGQVERVVVKVRETRLTGIFCHVLILITVAFLPSLISQIPVPVLDGLFVYCAIAAVGGNSFFERIQLLFTQQSKYPPTFYSRRCPQKVVHMFTMVEVMQLLVLVFVGYAPWPELRIIFPVFIALLMPVRHLILPRVFNPRHLEAVDAYH